MTTPDQEIRWLQRFDNFKKAFALLRQVMESDEDILTLSDLEKEGVIHRFEFTLELAWKTLKDKMQAEGLVIKQISPKYVFKLAYQSQYINDINCWLAMINDRNLMSHTYNFSDFSQVLISLQKSYYPELKTLYHYFIEQQLQL